MNVDRILQRWASSHSNARLDGSNGVFQAAGGARIYRNFTTTIITIIIYLISAPLPYFLKST